MIPDDMQSKDRIHRDLVDRIHRDLIDRIITGKIHAGLDRIKQEKKDTPDTPVSRDMDGNTWRDRPPLL